MSHPDRGTREIRKRVNKQREVTGSKGSQEVSSQNCSSRLLSSPLSRSGRKQFLSGEVVKGTKSKERGEEMWKARRWEAALPRCQLRGSKAEADSKFET